ncbi:sensor histidine kinase [Devosia sp. Root635]|uniref:sensor histidine kinase n=1 Tax=Devosia sp. Root635 TaxID=1736575 RepID=UPI0006FD39DA|nr:ATP-binding protein [Devosia sp. Root635]KRA46196.1 hypothetical protein ASD80_18215 [Devosia sp. Root635]
MRTNIPTPSLLLIVVTLLSVAVAVVVMWGATMVPWMGLRLALTPDGSQIQVIGIDDVDSFSEPTPGNGNLLLAIGPHPADPAHPPVVLEPSDITPEPDSFESFAAIDTFFQRQAVLDALLQEPVTLYMQSTYSREPFTTVTYPMTRPFENLPDGFWVQLLAGLAGVLISGWVWALKPGRLGPVLFFIGAGGMALSTTTSAIYANRELAMNADLFRVLVPVNNSGAVIFGLAMFGLLMIYPVRLIRPAWLWLLLVLFAVMATLTFGHIGLGPYQLYLFVAAATLAIFAAIGLQWLATRKRPADRAALGWLGLSIAVGCSAYTVLGAAPVLFDVPFGLPQSHVTGVLVVIYLGLAFGLSRFRLFELGDWAYRVLFYTVGTLLLVCIDAGLVVLLELDNGPALALSLLLVGFLYLPTRDWIWRRITARRRIEQHELFSAALDVAFAPSPAGRASRWRALLTRLFDPLEVTESTDIAAIGVSNDGLTLHLPPAAGSPPLLLAYPFAGRGLFSPQHQDLAEQLLTLVARAEEGREAYMRGVGEERRRMARDLHDDVGARLLTGLHTADETTRPTLQAALSDIRAIVSGLSGEEASLDRVLAETRHEAARRLEAAEIALDWPLPEAEIDAIQLDYRLHKALTSAVREIVSNVIRHSAASRFTVTATLSPGHLTVQFADNGKGLPPAALAGETAGFGLRNLRHRIGDIGGYLTLAAMPAGTTITLDIPLVLQPHTPEPGVPEPPLPLNSPA